MTGSLTMLRALFSSMVIMPVCLSQFAAAQPGQRYADVSLVSEREVAQAGETFFAAFDMVLEPGWHVYWRNPGDSGLPTEVSWAAEKTGETGSFVWPAPHELEVIENEIMDYGYSDRVVLPFSVTAQAGDSDTIHLVGQLNYLICKEVCIPEDASFDVVIPVAAEPVIDEVNGALIADWIIAAPTSLEGSTCLVEDGETWTLSLAANALIKPADYIRFFPFNDEIRHASPQTFSQGPNGASLTLTKGFDPEIAGALDGVVVVERPGEPRQAYEVSTSLCAAALSGTSGSGGGVVSASGSGGSINLLWIAGLALLGGMVLNLMPCVLPVLSIKAVGIVTAAANGNSAHLRAHGIWYTIGVVISFLVIAGVFLGLRSAGQLVSLGFQLQFPVIVAGLALLMFVIGLWLLGVFELGGSLQGVGGSLAAKRGNSGAFFTGVLAAVVGAPCVGPFLAVALGAVISQSAPIVLLIFGLIGLGMALPFLALSFVPALQNYLPKPGAWMERMKQFFAFPMFLTAAWLLSVLGEQAGGDAVMCTVAGATLIGFGIWALKTAGGQIRLVAITFGVATLIIGVVLPLQASLAGAPAGNGTAKSYAGDLETDVWSTARVDEVLSEGRGIFVDFTATWCATCQVNKHTTLKKDVVQQAFIDHDIVFMVADFTNRNAEIASEIQRYNRPGVPMYLYYAPGSREAKVLPQLLSVGLILEEVEKGAS